MFKSRGSPPGGEAGQGLVEYALILSLVAVVVLIAVVLFGESLQKTYCQVVYAVNPSAQIDICETIDVSCSASTGAHFIDLEAVVSDTQGADDIDTVDFYVDGSFIRTEYYVPYCLGSNPDGQTWCNDHNIGAGSHTVTAIATDAEGNTGKCETTVNVP